MFSSILQRNSCNKNKIDDQNVDKKKVGETQKPPTIDQQRKTDNNPVENAEWIDNFNVIRIAKEINESFGKQDTKKNDEQNVEPKKRKQNKSVSFVDQKVSTKELLNKRKQMAKDKNIHCYKVNEQKGRKSPRILRNKLKNFSNKESDPIILEEEDSEETDSDTMITYNYNPKRTLSEKDMLIEMELERKNKEKKDKRNQRVQMLKRLKKGVEKSKNEETKKRKRGDEQEHKQVEAKEKKIKKVKEQKKQKEEKPKTELERSRKRKQDSSKSKTKCKISSNLYSIRTRSSPKKLYDCVISLTDNQKKIVEEIGFGKLLKMVVNGIPAKLGYYVVNNFNPKTMEIKVGKLSIKVDEEAIEKLLGLPREGVQLTPENNQRETLGPDGKAFQERYGLQMITSKKILQMINFSEDRESHLFKYDFIVLFINTMVECHLNGICKVGIVDRIGTITDFKKINWCNYIVSLMKRAKDGWVPRDFASYFRGALTILTLLYVDSITCKGINEVRDCHPLYFWTMDRLKLREDLEIENDGFGKGDFRGLYEEEDESGNESSKESESTDDASEEEDKQEDDPVSLEEHKKKGEKLFESLMKDIDEFNKIIEEAKTKYPESEEIALWEKEYKEKLKTALESKSDECFKTPEHTQNPDGDEISSQPSFALGDVLPCPFAQSRLNAKKNEKKQDLQRPNRNKQPTYATKSPYVIREVDITRAVTKKEIKIWNYIMDTTKQQLFEDENKKEEKRTTAEEKESKDEKKTKEKENKEEKTCKEKDKHDPTGKKKCPLCEEEEIEKDFHKHIFETASGLSTKKFLFKTLMPGERISTNVIDCWAAVLNWDEDLKSEESNRRLFCDTNVIRVELLENEKVDEKRKLEIITSNFEDLLKGIKNKPELKHFQLVLIPIIESSHFYLVCFDLEKPAIEVLDNMHGSKSFVHLTDDDDFFKKSTIFKIKHMVVMYLKSMEHQKAEELSNTKPIKLTLKWATKKNATDCGVFLMRHMECYKKSNNNNWDCGIKQEKSKRQKSQLNKLRMKYAVKIVNSAANVHKEEVMKNADAGESEEEKEESLSEVF